jgi:hypothetical protein
MEEEITEKNKLHNIDHTNIQKCCIKILNVLYGVKPSLSHFEAVMCLTSVLGSVITEQKIDKDFVISILEATIREYKENFITREQNES